MWKLILAGVTVLSLLGAIASMVHSYNEGIRDEERAKIEKERVALQAKIDRENAEREEQGKEDANRLLNEADKQLKKNRAALATAERKRREEQDARAKLDLSYALWRESAVPEYPAQQLRDAVAAATADPNSRSVPAATPVSPVASLAVAAEREAHERRLAHIRAVLGFADQPKLAGR